MTVIAHVSQPYVTAGRMIDLYICSLLAALRSSVCSSAVTIYSMYLRLNLSLDSHILGQAILVLVFLLVLMNMVPTGGAVA